MLRALISHLSLVAICSMIVIPGQAHTEGRGPPLPSEVPREYADLYAALKCQLKHFARTARRLPARGGAAPIFGAHLLAR